MAGNYKQRVPATATAGLSLSFDPWLSCFPYPTWVATLLLRGPAALTISATTDGSQTFVVDAATTEAWAAGVYWYSLRVQSATQTLEVDSGQIEVLPDFASLPAGYDGRTPNEIALDAITAVLAKRATQDQQRYTIGDRELWRMTVADLLMLKASYSAAVRRERAAKSGRSRFGRIIPVRFT
jgi:hypothetical protein